MGKGERAGDVSPSSSTFLLLKLHSPHDTSGKEPKSAKAPPFFSETITSS